MEISSNYYYCNQDNRIPSSFLQNITNSNCMRVRDKFWNSINNNISTSLSSYDINNEKNICRNQNTRENNFLISSPYFCGCHPNNECIYIPECHCMPIYHCNSHCYTQHSNNLIIKNEEINKNDDKLFNEIFYLKRNLKKVENELNRTKTEKDASDFYIKELEKELSKLNMNNNNKISNINGKESKKRGVNSVKMRDFGKYHDMLNKSFEVLDSVSNKCSDPKGKTKGGVNYYYDREQDYNTVIDTQKNWVDNLPNEKFNKNEKYYENDNINNFCGPFNRSDHTGTNNLSNNGFPDDNRLNIFKYPENCNNRNDENNNIINNHFPYNPKENLPKNDGRNKSLSYISNYNNLDKEGKNMKENKTKPNINSYPKGMKKKKESKMNNKNNILINDNTFNQKDNKGIYFPKKENQKNNKIVNNEGFPYMPNINKNGYEKENNKNKKPNDKEKILNKRYIVVDKEGNPIFIEGKRLLAMEILPIIRKDGKEELDENGNIMFIGPDGERKNQGDLEAIILDNDLPLVNEENRPFLGINGIIMLNKYGNPIVGPGELYDKNNKVVQGELGILPKDNQGNLIKFKIKEEDPFLKDESKDKENNVDNIYENNYNSNNLDGDEGNNNYDNNNDSNFMDNINNNDKKRKKGVFEKNQKYKKNNNKNCIKKDNNLNINIKPLIGSDGKPVLDINQKPIMLDKTNKPIEGTGITILLDQTGKPVLNAIGEPILINKEGKPINLIDDNYEDDNINNPKIYYPYIDINNQIFKPNNNKKKNKKDIMNNNSETGRFNNNLVNEDNNEDFKYPKANLNYQRKTNYKPIGNMKMNQKENLNSCFACDVGCSVSRSGYSPMTYSPYDNRIKRRHITPLNNEENFN